MIISRQSPSQIFSKIEWEVIIFFMSLFVIIGALDKWGLLEVLARFLLGLSDNIFLLSIIILFTAGILSGIIGSIPFTVAFIPVVREISLSLQQGGGSSAGNPIDIFPASLPLWLALSLGACFGGLGTLFAGSPNLVIASLSEKTSHPVRFVHYLKIGVPFTLFCLGISALYLWIRYA